MEYKTTDTELTSVANAIRTKGGTTEPLTYPNEFISAIQNIPTGGVTPTGNINITHSGRTDVTNYATATVPTADANAGSISSSYVTENNQRKWKFTYEGYAESPGWVDEGAFGSPLTYEYNAIPSNTTITPTTSAQTIGGQNYMMEGAVTVSAVPSMTLPSATSTTPTGTRRANLYPSTSQQYLNIPAGLNDTARYYQIIGMDLAPLNVTQNGTYNASDVDVTGFNTVTVNVPSGASNIVQGNFGTITGAGVMTINIPYTGNGYPIVAVVVIKDGAYNSAYSHWYSSTQRYAVGQWTMSKSDMTSAPTYTTSGTQNQGVVTAIYKNSTSSSTSYTRTSAMNTNVFSSGNASNSAVNTIKFKTGNVMSIYVNTSSYGLLPQTNYSYYIIYSE